MILINSTKSAIRLINNSKNKLNSKISIIYLFIFILNLEPNHISNKLELLLWGPDLRKYK